MIQAITVKGWLKRVGERLALTIATRFALPAGKCVYCVSRTAVRGDPCARRRLSLFFSFTPDRRKTIVPAELRVLRHHSKRPNCGSANADPLEIAGERLLASDAN